jgi:hypothetical protein
MFCSSARGFCNLFIMHMPIAAAIGGHTRLLANHLDYVMPDAPKTARQRPTLMFPLFAPGANRVSRCSVSSCVSYVLFEVYL